MNLVDNNSRKDELMTDLQKYLLKCEIEKIELFIDTGNQNNLFTVERLNYFKGRLDLLFFLELIEENKYNKLSQLLNQEIIKKY